MTWYDMIFWTTKMTENSRPFRVQTIERAFGIGVPSIIRVIFLPNWDSADDSKVPESGVATLLPDSRASEAHPIMACRQGAKALSWSGEQPEILSSRNRWILVSFDSPELVINIAVSSDRDSVRRFSPATVPLRSRNTGSSLWIQE